VLWGSEGKGFLVFLSFVVGQNGLVGFFFKDRLDLFGYSSVWLEASLGRALFGDCSSVWVFLLGYVVSDLFFVVFTKDHFSFHELREFLTMIKRIMPRRFNRTIQDFFYRKPFSHLQNPLS